MHPKSGWGKCAAEFCFRPDLLEAGFWTMWQANAAPSIMSGSIRVRHAQNTGKNLKQLLGEAINDLCAKYGKPQHCNREEQVTHPPLAVFEILSPEDIMTRILGKLSDYEAMGIEGIFVIDPASEKGLREMTDEERVGDCFTVKLADIRAQLD